MICIISSSSPMTSYVETNWHFTDIFILSWRVGTLSWAFSPDINLPVQIIITYKCVWDASWKLLGYFSSKWLNHLLDIVMYATFRPHRRELVTTGYTDVHWNVSLEGSSDEVKAFNHSSTHKLHVSRHLARSAPPHPLKEAQPHSRSGVTAHYRKTQYATFLPF